MIGVVKIGGASGNALEPLMDEVAKRVAAGERWIVVHGASGVMNDLCAERGVAIRMVTSPSGYRSRFVYSLYGTLADMLLRNFMKKGLLFIRQSNSVDLANKVNAVTMTFTELPVDDSTTFISAST